MHLLLGTQQPDNICTTKPCNTVQLIVVVCIGTPSIITSTQCQSEWQMGNILVTVVTSIPQCVPPLLNVSPFPLCPSYHSTELSTEIAGTLSRLLSTSLNESSKPPPLILICPVEWHGNSSRQFSLALSEVSEGQLLDNSTKASCFAAEKETNEMEQQQPCWWPVWNFLVRICWMPKFAHTIKWNML